MEIIVDNSEGSGSESSETRDDIRTKLDGFFPVKRRKGARYELLSQLTFAKSGD